MRVVKTLTLLSLAGLTMAACVMAWIASAGTAIARRGPEASAAATNGAASVRGTIVYTSSTRAGSRLYTLDLATGSRRRLTNGRGDQTAQWDAAGRRLTFIGTRNNAAVVMTMAFGSRSVRAVTKAGAIEEDPSWSPDGRRIAFARTVLPTGRETTFSQIWVVNAGGGGARQLTHTRSANAGPDWSPNSGTIAFSRYPTPSASTPDLWTMRADGSHQRRLVRNGRHAAWSPDGRSIAYGRDTGKFRNCCPITDLFVVGKQGRDPRRLVHNGARPTWSPDGRSIVFQRFSGDRIHLWIVNADGTGARQLTFGSGTEYAPSWRPT